MSAASVVIIAVLIGPEDKAIDRKIKTICRGC
jgi:hypothetical protein